jgi:ABC-type phosphate transport system substrate-binding protein
VTPYPSILCLLLLLIAPGARADLVLVANPKSGIDRLSRDEVVNIYLGRYRRLAGGQTAEPIDLLGEPDSKTQFYRKLVDKNLAEINAYWARLVFSGKTRPPQQVASTEEALQHVAARSGALAYVERTKADRRVAIVFELGE